MARLVAVASAGLPLAGAATPLGTSVEGAAAPAPYVLIVGDSTAAGTGSDPRHSVAGRLAADFPETRIENRGRDGARLRDVAEQLGDPRDATPQLIVIQAGGNDILRLASAARIEADSSRVLELATARAERVVLITPGNLRSAPRFPWPVSAVLGWRSRVGHEAMARVAAEFGVFHVPMYQPVEEDPFAQEPARFFSADGVHPSSEGYGLWYRTLRLAVPLASWLAPRPRPRA